MIMCCNYWVYVNISQVSQEKPDSVDIVIMTEKGIKIMKIAKKFFGKIKWLARFVQTLSFFMLVVIFPLNIIQGAESRSESDTERLEAQIWNEAPEKLFQVERGIVNIIQNNPKSVYGHYLYARYLMRLYLENPFDQDVIKKINTVSLQTKMLQQKGEWHFLLEAEYLDMIGESEKAVALVQSLIKDKTIKKSWRAYFDLARYRMGIASNEEITKLLKLSLENMHGNSSIVLPYLITHLKGSESPKALLAHLEKLDKIYHDEQLKMALGQMYSENKRFKEAAQKFSEVIAINPQNGDAQINVVLLNNEGKKENIYEMKKIESILARGDIFLSDERKVGLYFKMGSYYLHSKAFDAANNAFVQALKKNYDKQAMITEIYRDFSREHEYAHLEGFLKYASDKIPGEPFIYGALGRIYSEQLKKQTEAIVSYKNALLLDPEQTDFYNGIGVAFYHMENYGAAINAFQAAISVDPEDALAHYNVACLLAKFGKSREALASLSTAISLDPTLRLSALSDADFASLKESKDFMALTAKHTEPGLGDDEPDVFMVETQDGTAPALSH